jgi:hypothetical protein
MLVGLKALLVGAALCTLYWAVKLAIASVEPYGGIAFAVMVPLGSSATVMAIAMAALAICERLDKQRNETTALREAVTQVLRANWPAPPPPRTPSDTPVDTALVELLGASGEHIVDLGGSAVTLMVRGADGRVDQFGARINKLRGRWIGNEFITESLLVTSEDGGLRLIELMNIRQIGPHADALTKAAGQYLSGLAVAVANR